MISTQTQIINKVLTQLGIFTVGDVTMDPTTARRHRSTSGSPTCSPVQKKGEEVGFEVFALGDHRSPPFIPSSPSTMLGCIAATTEKLILSTATTLITTNDPVKIAEDCAMPHRLWTEDVVDW